MGAEMSRCPHCGTKIKDGRIARVGVAAVRARLLRGDLYKTIAADIGVTVNALNKWCYQRGLTKAKLRGQK
jgi:hypothetical protein